MLDCGKTSALDWLNLSKMGVTAFYIFRGFGVCLVYLLASDAHMRLWKCCYIYASEETSLLSVFVGSVRNPSDADLQLLVTL